MRIFTLLLISTIASLTISCIKKSKESEEAKPIIIKSSSNDTNQPVQIPMHGTKENSSSGMENTQLKEQLQSTNNKKEGLNEKD